MGVDGSVGEGVAELRLMLSGGPDKGRTRCADLLGMLQRVIQNDELGRRRGADHGAVTVDAE
jgi:hypothetical protein